MSKPPRNKFLRDVKIDRRTRHQMMVYGVGFMQGGKHVSLHRVHVGWDLAGGGGGCGMTSSSSRVRASKGWRRHVRRTKAGKS